jgi:hypothetical protein
VTAVDDTIAQNSIIGFNRPGQCGYTSSSATRLRRRIAGTETPLSHRLDTHSFSLGNKPPEYLTPTREETSLTRLNVLRKNIDALTHAIEEPVVGHESITGLEKWSAQIVDIDDEFFQAELVPEGADSPPLLADFSRDSVSPEDEDLVRVGAAFYVTVRTVEDRGRRARTSTLRFRRLGVWTSAEVELIEESGRERFRRVQRFTD